MTAARPARTRIAILGAGVAGLTAARVLIDAGHQVTVFDKGRGVGGRLATRRREQGAFDHGAQRFSVRSPAFVVAAQRWAEEGLIVPTEVPGSARDEAFWIPRGAASALAKHLAVDIPVRLSARVTRLFRASHAWHLDVFGAESAGPFDVVLCTMPTPQAVELLAPLGKLDPRLTTPRFTPTWALMLVCEREGVALPEAIFTEAASDDDDVALVAREGLKPGRQPDESWVRLVVHASTRFSEAELESSEPEVAARLVAALRRWPGMERLRPAAVQAHRWRYARVDRALGEPCWMDHERGLGVGGDGMLGPRIEAAWLSGRALAEQVMAR